MSWTNIIIDKDQIIAKTNKAILVKEPQSDWMVWVSWKVVRRGKSSTNISAGFRNELEYRVFRENQDREIISEEHVSGIDVARRWRAPESGSTPTEKT